MAPYKHGTACDRPAAWLAEYRMREWTMDLEAHRKRLEQTASVDPSNEINPYIAISREAGAGGGTVARRVGEILGWDVLHRELLDTIADRHNLQRDMLEMIDEKTSNWLVELFGKWLDPSLVTQTEYLAHLGQTILLAAQHASTVFVGRGAQYFLPASRGITVYLVAPLPVRIRHICEYHGWSEAESERYIRETEEGRRHLIERCLHKRMGDPHSYDLVINREHVTVEQAAELIIELFRRRFPED